MKNGATSTLHKNRNRGVASSSKTDHVPMESGRQLYDQANNRTFEKKRLPVLGKVRILPALSFDCTANFKCKKLWKSTHPVIRQVCYKFLTSVSVKIDFIREKKK